MMNHINKWITRKVQEGRGAVVFGLEENDGMVGVWIGGGENDPALGCGDDAFEAVLEAMKRERIASKEDDSNLPEWYQMVKEVFGELGVFSQGFYEDMNCANVLAQVRYAAMRDKERSDEDQCD